MWKKILIDAHYKTTIRILWYCPICQIFLKFLQGGKAIYDIYYRYAATLKMDKFEFLWIGDLIIDMNQSNVKNTHECEPTYYIFNVTTVD